jgi:hypothetical protein
VQCARAPGHASPPSLATGASRKGPDGPGSPAAALPGGEHVAHCQGAYRGQ